MRPHEMVRVAEGWANLRAPLPAAPWLDRLTLHGQAAASSGALPQADVLRLQRALEALQAQDMLAAGGK